MRYEYNWIKYIGDDLPLPFWERPNQIQNEYGSTLAMCWVYYVKKDPLEWMRYDPTIQDNFGFINEWVWKRFVKTDPPKWMRYEPYQMYLRLKWML